MTYSGNKSGGNMRLINKNNIVILLLFLLISFIEISFSNLSHKQFLLENNSMIQYNHVAMFCSKLFIFALHLLTLPILKKKQWDWPFYFSTNFKVIILLLLNYVLKFLMSNIRIKPLSSTLEIIVLLISVNILYFLLYFFSLFKKPRKLNAKS